ncbi:hypothetical protein DVH24_031116 [Malus domestica]|uniref:Uncharacterized protein n=1 Tax=Malus domestica TaxID=3750 RepID=A0A498HIM0_MALDO|nr:hypothetical protein DVH24_031116 [Malus domestica]
MSSEKPILNFLLSERSFCKVYPCARSFCDHISRTKNKQGPLDRASGHVAPLRPELYHSASGAKSYDRAENHLIGSSPREEMCGSMPTPS